MLKNVRVFLSLLCLTSAYRGAQTYSQISAYGTGTADEGPRIFKALNADLIFPKTFNSTVNVISTTQAPQMTTPTPLPTYITERNSNFASTPSPSIVYVTPPAETFPAAQIRKEQVIQSNSPPAPSADQNQNDYPTRPLRQHSYENTQRRANKQFQQQQQLQQPLASTGRAVDYRPAYQLDQFVNAGKPNSVPYALRSTHKYQTHSQAGQTAPYRSNNLASYLQDSYRQYQRPAHAFRRPPSNGGRAQIADRFTPGEAVASALFSKNNHQHHHHHSDGIKSAAASDTVQSYVPPKDLYSFPPNLKAKYPKPSDDPRTALPSSSINSYAPPPAGPITSQVNYPLSTAASSNEGYSYKGPFNPAYLPPSDGGDEKNKDNDDIKSSAPSDSDDQNNGDDTIGVLPASAMDDGDMNGGDTDMKDMADMTESDHDPSHDHDHDHPPTAYDTGKEYPTPPPGWMEEHPDHDHDHDHDHGVSFPHHHFPDVIYDDHHFHDHFEHDFIHDHHVEPPSTTLPPPPPEPLPSEQPQEPRVKKYSYFYIGRKLWYIPLYFTVWFSFYVLWLIIKSIARHKVNLPNHYVSRRSLPASTDARAKEYINQLTISVLKQIEDFQRKR